MIHRSTKREIRPTERARSRTVQATGMSPVHKVETRDDVRQRLQELLDQTKQEEMVNEYADNLQDLFGSATEDITTMDPAPVPQTLLFDLDATHDHGHSEAVTRTMITPRHVRRGMHVVEL